MGSVVEILECLARFEDPELLEAAYGAVEVAATPGLDPDWKRAYMGDLIARAGAMGRRRYEAQALTLNPRSPRKILASEPAAHPTRAEPGDILGRPIRRRWTAG